jgi:hypothetical protein
MNHLKKLIPLLFLLLSTVAVANAFNTPLAPDTASELQYCPRVEKLTIDQNYIWHAPGGWKSGDPSFNKQLDTFVGAQWIGINVGEIICAYQKSTGKDFPVTLYRRVLVTAPRGGKWTEDKGGHQDCRSNQVADCLFLVQVRRAPKNPYDEIDFFKDHPVDK